MMKYEKTRNPMDAGPSIKGRGRDEKYFVYLSFDMRVKRYFAPHTTPLSAQIQNPVPAVSEGLLLRPSVWWTC